MYTIIFHYTHAWKSQTIIKKNKINYSDPPQKRLCDPYETFSREESTTWFADIQNLPKETNAYSRRKWTAEKQSRCQDYVRFSYSKMTSASQSLSTIYIPAIEKHIKEYMSRRKIKVNLCREGSYSLAHTLKTWTSRPVFRWGKRYSQIKVKL